MQNGSRPTVAFVDDEPNVLSGLRRALRARAGEWDMVFFQSAEEFWEIRCDDWPDVAVLDLTMPGWSGLELATKLREAGAKTRCIMLTGNADLNDAMAFINEASVFRYYMKPCDTDALAGAVKAALEDLGTDAPATVKATTSDTVGPESMLADRLVIGTLILDGEGRVSYVNKVGLQILGDGAILKVDPDKRPRGISADATRRLNEVIAAASGGVTGFLAVGDETGGGELHIVAFASPGETGGPKGVSLLISDPARARYPKAPTLRHLFGLTVSESRLVEHLIRGLSLEEAGETVGLKVSSSRTYLKSIFSKMGVSRQAELVQKALTSSAAVVLLDE
jgi:DNA-binding NarL/FixJ family response regulator